MDLGVFNKKDHIVSFKESIVWSIVWIVAAIAFMYIIKYESGAEASKMFITGYILERSLSVDNIFVFILIFEYFRVPAILQQRVLFWGIVFALVLRAFFIFTGAALLNSFAWIMYVFGAILIITGAKLALSKEDDSVDPEKNYIVKLCKRFIPITNTYVENKFFVTQNLKRCATPLFLVMVTIATSDIIFAVDSIPAIFAITTDPYIVFTANVFAVMGLRAMFFLVSDIISMFHYLKHGLSIILIFIGVKMCIVDFYHISIDISLVVIGAILAFAIAASVAKTRLQKA